MCIRGGDKGEQRGHSELKETTRANPGSAAIDRIPRPKQRNRSPHKDTADAKGASRRERGFEFENRPTHKALRQTSQRSGSRGQQE